MSNFLNDVRVVPLSVQSDITKNSRPAVSLSVDSDGESTTNPKGVTVHVSKHSDGIPFEAVPITAIVFTFIYLIIKAIMAPFTNRARHAPSAASGGGLSAEEIAILQKLERTLSQMESRVEALETILIDQARTAKNYGSKL